jgi:uncharacterized RDD family membrane protein YckC
MMTCEKCEKELPSSLGTCDACGHNPVLQRMDVWREKRQQKLATFQPAEEKPSPGTRADVRASVRGPRAEAKEATLIRFPKRTTAPPEPPPVPTDVVPAWKERLNSRLREIREQRALAVEPPAAPPPAPEKFDRNPIITNALNRIQKADYLQPITPLPRSRTAVAAELAPLPIEESLPTSLPVLEIKPTPKKTIVTRIPTTSLRVVPEPRFEVTPPIETPALIADEEVLPEVHFDPIVATPAPDLQDVLEPEPSAPTHSTLEAAALSKRFAAAVIDAEIIALSLLPLFGAYFFLSGWFAAPTLYLPLAVGLVLTTAYYFVTYALAGRTMGMAWCNLHLASLTPNADSLAQSSPGTVTFTIRQALLRSLGGTLSLTLFPLNMLCIVRSDERLSLSDYLSQTQVVRIRK